MLFSTELDQEKLIPLTNVQNESNEDADDGIVMGDEDEEDGDDEAEEMVEEEVEDEDGSDNW